MFCSLFGPRRHKPGLRTVTRGAAEIKFEPWLVVFMFYPTTFQVPGGYYLKSANSQRHIVVSVELGGGGGGKLV